MPSSLSFFDEGSSLKLALRSLDPLHFFIFRVRALDTVSLEPSNIVVQGTFCQKIARTQVATRGNTMMMQRRHVALSAWLGDCDKQDTSHEPRWCKHLPSALGTSLPACGGSEQQTLLTDRLPPHENELLWNLSLEKHPPCLQCTQYTVTDVEGTLRRTIFWSCLRCRSLASLLSIANSSLGASFGTHKTNSCTGPSTGHCHPVAGGVWPVESLCDQTSKAGRQTHSTGAPHVFTTSAHGVIRTIV